MIVFHHAPWSRSSAILWLLEELGVEYRMDVVDIRAEGGVPEDYRRIQPHKKVPAVEVDGVTVTERAAITTFLADRFQKAGLAPALDDPMRGPYLSMLAYTDAVFDPCTTARIFGWEYPVSGVAFGAFEDMVAYLDRILGERRFAAGDRFTAADTQLASSLGYVMSQTDALPKRQSFIDYVARATDRPAERKAREIDKELAMKTPFFQKMFEGQAEAKEAGKA